MAPSVAKNVDYLVGESWNDTFNMLWQLVAFGLYHFDMSLKLPSVYCKRCIVEIYRHAFCYIYTNSSLPTNKSFESINSGASKSGIIEVDDHLLAPNPNKGRFSMQISRRRFENKNLNCWANALVQVLFSSPLRQIVTASTDIVGIH